MRRILSVILAAGLCLALSACDFVVTDTEGLLERPTLNARQAAVYRALADSLGSEDVVYRRPQRGEYRSSFLFYDMNGDGSDEAIVFYALERESGATRATLLSEGADGVWQAVSDLPVQSGQIDFVLFSKLLSQGSSCMLIGWQSPPSQTSRAAENFLGIYSYTDGGLIPEIDRQHYQHYAVTDLDDDGLDDVVTVGREEGTRYGASLIRSVGPRLDRTAMLPLSADADSLLRLSTDSLGYGYGAVYIDESCTNNGAPERPPYYYATEVIQVDRTGMSFLSGDVDDEEESESPFPRSSFEFTIREETLLSEDIDGDGEIEIPAQSNELPGDPDNWSRAPVRLTQYLVMTRGDGVDLKCEAVANAAGYLLIYPEKWKDRVAVYESDGPDEWRFFAITDTGEQAAELLRILAYSDSVAGEGDPDEIDLGSRGARRFTGYIPHTEDGEPAAITEEELRDMFLLPGGEA